jgi:hypothetical protein
MLQKTEYTPEFRAILRSMAYKPDWLAEGGGFELSVPRQISAANRAQNWRTFRRGDSAGETTGRYRAAAGSERTVLRLSTANPLIPFPVDPSPWLACDSAFMRSAPTAMSIANGVKGECVMNQNGREPEHLPPLNGESHDGSGQGAFWRGVRWTRSFRPGSGVFKSFA